MIAMYALDSGNAIVQCGNGRSAFASKTVLLRIIVGGA